MKKIGIMSMQRIRNYGSFMQAYGLKTTIENISKDYQVEFVDFEPGDSLVNDQVVDKIYDSDFKQKLHKKVINVIFAIKYKLFWLPKYLKVNKYNEGLDISTLIIGSDEVFNCTQPGKRIGFSKDLFGEKHKNSNVISYAASFGYTNIDRLKKYKIDTDIKDMLSKNFSNISVRDNNSMEIVKKLTNLEPFLNLDPVLISNVDKFANGKIKDSNYIIIYSYACRISKEEGEQIKEYAKSNGKKIISIGTYQECADKTITPDPFKMLNYFKNADGIITDTFHGTIFSIIFNRKFVTLIRNSNSNKLVDLLNRLKLENRIVNNLKDLKNNLNKEIDYKITNKIIENERNNAINYLKNNIK